MSAERGIQVWRNEHPHEGWAIYSDDLAQNPLTLGALGQWFPEAEAQALVDVAEAARKMTSGKRFSIELAAALARLDEARR